MKGDASDKAQRERALIAKHYRQATKTRLQQQMEAEPRLRTFDAALRKFVSIDDAEAMLSFISIEAFGWVVRASPDTRSAALRLISDRIIHIREQAGLVPFDDPLPDEGEDKNDVFQVCRKVLG